MQPRTDTVHDENRSSAKPDWAVIGSLIVFAFLFYLPGLLDRDFSMDELGQFSICQEPIEAITTRFFEAQNHPLYSVIGHFTLAWLPFSKMTSFRLPALVAGLLLPVVFYATHRNRLGPPAAGIISLALIVVDPVREYATAGRAYGMLMLGAASLNALALRSAETRSAGLLLWYVLTAVATVYAHLWGAILVVSHAVFLGVEMSRGRIGWNDFARAAVAIALAAILVVGCYWPMRDEVLSMASTKQPEPILPILLTSFAELPRFGDWTLGACVFAIPVLLAGLRWAPPMSQLLRFHFIVLGCHGAAVLMVHPSNFGSRFLLGTLPSLFALAGWALAGHFAPRQQPVDSNPRLPSVLAGFAIGVLLSLAPVAHNIPAGARPTYHFSNAIAQLVGLDLAATLLVVAAIVYLVDVPAPTFVLGSGLLFSSLAAVVVVVVAIPVVLGIVVLLPDWLVETHRVAIGAAGVAIWDQRANPATAPLIRIAALLSYSAVIAASFSVGSIHSPGVPGTIQLVALPLAAVLVVRLLRPRRNEQLDRADQ